MKDQETIPLLAEQEATTKPKKYLILTSSGGGGHVNAAQARKSELNALGIPDAQIDIIDLMGLYQGVGASNAGKPWVPTYSFFDLDPVFSGKSNTAQWDEAQREGTEEAVRKLEGLVELQPFAEKLQASDVERNLSKYLEENDVQAVYNTQALSTPAICQAVVKYNEAHEKTPLSITTTVTDLITHRAEHFLSSLQKLTPAQQKVLTMEIATAPMTDPGETETQFLDRYGIPEGLFVPKAKLGRLDEEVYRAETTAGKYTLPVKKEVLELPKPEDKDKIVIKANKSNDDAEFKYLSTQLGRNTAADATVDVEIKKSPNDKLITITMGSQGSNTVLEYMDSFKEQLLHNPPAGKGDIYLCIAAGKSGSGSLYEKVKSHAAAIMDELPPEVRSRVKILPLAFQDGKHMASLLNNSDVLITRSGGMSAMEAVQTHGRNPNRQVFVHSEAKLKYPDNFPKHSFDATYEALMQGTVKWEGGNAEYLLREIGASLGSPELIDFGFANQDKSENIKENSLFHFAYDKKLNEKHTKKIETLIREGSNPNMRFPGGSYLIDHCQDFATKELLVQYGAHITAKSLAGLSEDEKGQLQAAHTIFKKDGLKKPEPGNDKQQKAYLYLNPMQPTNPIEHVIVAMDKVGKFIRNKILMTDYVHDCLDATRMYLRTDPTEKRTPLKRLKQFRNFLFDVTTFIAKQPVYAVTKPIAFVSNLARTVLVGSSMIYNSADGTKSNISNYSELKATAKKTLKDLKDTVVAWGTGALVLSGFGAPIAFSIGGVSASISLGAASFGAANVAIAPLNSALVQAVALTGTPAGSAVLTTEAVAEWSIFRPLMYFKLNPKKLFYKKDQSSSNELNPLGKKVKELHETSQNPDISIELRREASEQINKILKGKKTEHVTATAAKAVLTPFKVKDRAAAKAAKTSSTKID